MPYKKENTEVHLSALFLQKGISFCLYRFPHTQNYQLALQKDLLPGNGTSFIIAPFGSDKITELQKADPKNLDASFYEKLNALPDKSTKWASLPLHTVKEDYFKKIHLYLAHIRRQKPLKAILSRVKIIDKPKEFDPFDFYQKLCVDYPETFASLFYIPGKGIWAGATSELLLQKEGNHYYTMALAATQPRNADSKYQWGKKEKDEHNLVREHIESVFKINNCRLISLKGPYAFETGKVAHLKTDYQFESENGAELTHLLADLHPTPAIGGSPVKEALELIKKYEGYNRNYYTGYLGEINTSGTARLFINLRCMQIGKSKIAVFVGGGISASSDPEEEWEETIQKSRTLLEIIESPKTGKI